MCVWATKPVSVQHLFFSKVKPESFHCADRLSDDIGAPDVRCETDIINVSKHFKINLLTFALYKWRSCPNHCSTIQESPLTTWLC